MYILDNKTAIGDVDYVGGFTMDHFLQGLWYARLSVCVCVCMRARLIIYVCIHTERHTKTYTHTHPKV